MTVKTFRGLMADGVQDIINLHTNDGKTGYRIVKFEIMFTTPGAANAEHVVKIYKISQGTIDAVIDFSENTLLAAGYIKERAGTAAADYGHGLGPIIFDNEIFNQDIFVTHSAINSAIACNYYIELEQIPLDLNESTVATLQSIRDA